jgi:hypothetical protein
MVAVPRVMLNINYEATLTGRSDCRMYTSGEKEGAETGRMERKESKKSK